MNISWRPPQQQRISERIFYSAFGMLAVFNMLTSAPLGFDGMMNLAYLLVVALCSFRILFVRASHIGAIISIIMIPVLGLCTMLAWDPVIVVVIAMVIAAQDIYFDTIVRISFWIVLVFCILIVGLSLCGILPDDVTLRTLGNDLVECHTLGFYHYSKLPTFWFMLYMEDTYLHRENYRLSRHMCWLLGGYVVYLVCHERLRFYLLIMAFILFSITQRLKHRPPRKITRWIAAGTFPALLIASILLAYYYVPTVPWFSTLNELLSGRLTLEHTALEQYGIPPFGQYVAMQTAESISSPSDYFFIDAAYLYVPIVYGTIMTVLIFGCYAYVSYRAVFTSKVIFLWCMLFAIDCLVGNQIMSVWLCPLPLLLFCRYDQQPQPLKHATPPRSRHKLELVAS